jgi:hypothetical protein
VSDSVLCRRIFTVQLAIVDDFSERLDSGVSMTYACLGELGAQAGLVPGDGELQDVIRVCRDTALGEE